jgi:hypothetical protein
MMTSCAVERWLTLRRKEHLACADGAPSARLFPQRQPVAAVIHLEEPRPLDDADRATAYRFGPQLLQSMTSRPFFVRCSYGPIGDRRVVAAALEQLADVSAAARPRGVSLVAIRQHERIADADLRSVAGLARLPLPDGALSPTGHSEV